MSNRPHVDPPRSRFAALAICLSVIGCGGSTPARPNPYLDDAAYRRLELEASLVNPENGYSQLRLAHYATGTPADWDRLPEWNPVVSPIAVAELDAPGGAVNGPLASNAANLILPDDVAAIDEAALVALGKVAFERYPTQLAAYLSVALTSPASAQSYGLWTDDARGVGGLVRVRLADGSLGLAVTCSTCHAAHENGSIADGLPNARLDLGAAIVDSAHGGLDPDAARLITDWGPGRLDVTTTTGSEPARIADLRPVQWQTNLQQDATLLARDRTTLAIRIETLIITSSAQVVRPPRLVALALAAYVTSLGQALPPTSIADAASPQGARVFATHCSSCHVPPAFSGPAVPLPIVGTDPTLGLSRDRGTGQYRVPSLRGVATRGPLLHDGTLPSIESMFDPERTSATFSGGLHGVHAVPGHPFGLDLDDEQRSALIAYLRAL